MGCSSYVPPTPPGLKFGVTKTMAFGWPFVRALSMKCGVSYVARCGRVNKDTRARRENEHVERGVDRHRRQVLVKDRPFVFYAVVLHTDWKVGVHTSANSTGIVVRRDKDNRIWVTVRQGIVNGGAVTAARVAV